jgi:hypothetical protein
VPVWTDTAMSLHQATFQELLSLARLRDRFPQQITLVGVQPVVLDDLGGSLSPEVRARVDEAVQLAVAELAAWGVRHAAHARARPDRCSWAPARWRCPSTKAERPSAEAACRVGDDRFLNPTGAAQAATEPATRSPLMCIGNPAGGGHSAAKHHAWCEADGHRECLDMQLVGPAARGHLGAGLPGRARQVMGHEEARHRPAPRPGAWPPCCRATAHRRLLRRPGRPHARAAAAPAPCRLKETAAMSPTLTPAMTDLRGPRTRCTRCCSVWCS